MATKVGQCAAIGRTGKARLSYGGVWAGHPLFIRSIIFKPREERRALKELLSPEKYYADHGCDNRERDRDKEGIRVMLERQFDVHPVDARHEGRDHQDDSDSGEGFDDHVQVVRDDGGEASIVPVRMLV